MSVACAETTGLNFSGARSVDVEPCGERAADRITKFEAVEKILGFAGTCSGDMKVVQMVAHDFGQGDEAFRKNVGAGDGDVANVAGCEGGTL
jgi:hypothetical protein